MCLAIALNEVQLKPFKQIYINWIYDKYLRNRELKKMIDRYKETRAHIPCLLNTCHCSSEYFLRSKDKTHVLSVPSFVEHPNSSMDM